MPRPKGAKNRPRDSNAPPRKTPICQNCKQPIAGHGKHGGGNKYCPVNISYASRGLSKSTDPESSRMGIKFDNQTVDDFVKRGQQSGSSATPLEAPVALRWEKPMCPDFVTETGDHLHLTDPWFDSTPESSGVSAASSPGIVWPPLTGDQLQLYLFDPNYFANALQFVMISNMQDGIGGDAGPSL
ncbi:hypothetical protein JR316_0004432 [Psilocybe cubensis]|uniref:Uncharacterized protein n=2 Tax=Psilocybe cubensis TaxID=181762 RepID=A0ACB8H3B6_PSICU|nr:hypothetical protein JR316_0004432 [Psilocybe cubensis]KAH9482334.1 hypothetical protein JR316_0004432 [Psilocybe cubensis]